MSDYPVWGILLAILFVTFNAFFVLAEFAIVKVRVSRVQELEASGNLLAPLLMRRILPRLDAYLSVTQIGITIASIALGWIGEPALATTIEKAAEFFGFSPPKLPHQVTFLIAFFLISAAHVVFGELIPKTIAIQKAETMALWCAKPLQFFYYLFYPLLWFLTWIANSILSLFGIKAHADHEHAYSPQELRILLSSSKERGILDPQMFFIIDNAFSFRARKVKDVMVPKERVIALSLSMSWKENRDLVRRYRHTRYPLCETSIENPIGLVHLKDIMLRSFSSTKEADLRRFRRELFELAPDTPLDRAMTFLRSHSAHLAIVRAPGGPVQGIVCLEDMVEQIVGSLEDEFDREEKTPLFEVFDPKLIDLGSEVAQKKTLFETGIAKIHALHPDFDTQVALAAMEQRETLFSTGIGEGVAVPHAVLEDLLKPRLAVLRLKKGIDYHSIDFQPVRLVFLFLLPATNPGLRLRFFAEIAKLLQIPGMQEKLLAAANTEKFIELIRTGLKS